MPAYYLCVISLGLCVFYTQISLKHYSGSSTVVYNILDIGAKIGFLSYVSFMITATFFDTGWNTIPLFLATCALAAATYSVGKMSEVGLGALAGTVIFNIIVWTSIF